MPWRRTIGGMRADRLRNLFRGHKPEKSGCRLPLRTAGLPVPWESVLAGSHRREAVLKTFQQFTVEHRTSDLKKQMSYGMIATASTLSLVDPFLYVFVFVNNTRSSQKIINPKTMISGT